MKKTVLFIAVMLCILKTIFAEAAELKNKLPTEWLNMEKMDEMESEMLRGKDELYIYMQSSGYIRYLKNDDSESFSSSSIFFKEIIGKDEFYWQIAFPEVKYQLPFPAAVIGLYYKKNNSLLFFGGVLSDFCITVAAQGTKDKGFQYRADTFQIIKKRDGAKGVIVYTNCTGLNDDLSYNAVRKGSVCGYTEAKYYLFDSNSGKGFTLNDSDAIRINASDFLWDEKNPLHYSLQNAFDGNPATSYVENTEDDLMKLEFSGFKSMFNRKVNLAIINGYSSNKELYIANNRILNLNANSYKVSDDKTELILREPISLELQDMNLKYQIVSFDYNNRIGSFSFNVTKIVKGKFYNDTCLAELNLSESTDYIFGDIYE